MNSPVTTAPISNGSLQNALPRLTTRGWLTLLIAFYVVMATAFSIINPIFEAPDEHHHYFIARYLA